MARPVIYTWPASAATAVALAQSAAIGPLVLNGTLVTNGIAIDRSLAAGSTAPYAYFGGNARTVSVTSNYNPVAPVTLTITGTLNGAVVSDTRTVGNTTINYTTQLFETVTSVTTDVAIVAANTVSVGSGTTGHTAAFKYNYHASVLGVGCQVTVTAGTLTYDLSTTFDDISTVATPAWTKGVVIPSTTATFSWQVVMNSSAIAATTTVVASAFYPQIFNYARINITVDAGVTGALTATFIQQGLV